MGVSVYDRPHNGYQNLRERKFGVFHDFLWLKVRMVNKPHAGKQAQLIRKTMADTCVILGGLGGQLPPIMVPGNELVRLFKPLRTWHIP